jgi:hypothetical protein
MFDPYAEVMEVLDVRPEQVDLDFLLVAVSASRERETPKVPAFFPTHRKANSAEDARAAGGPSRRIADFING